jgi:signal transduction histidine kinase
VESADLARRRIERDLHDGAQQQLVALGMAMRLSRAQIETNPQGAATLLDEAMAELTRTTKGLRELARGIHPAVLTEGGIKPAVESLVSRVPWPVEVLEAPDRRFAAEIEATVYFLVAEALTNVGRYAEAGRAEVSIRCEGTDLEIEIADDGRGGADPAGGSGLRGLADRLVAVDGELRVHSPPGEGTRLWARIPFE